MAIGYAPTDLHSRENKKRFMDNGKYSEQHEVTFSEKRWHEKLLDFIKFLPHEVPVFIAVSISLWGFSEKGGRIQLIIST